MKECAVCSACADDAVDRCPNDGTLLGATIPGSLLLDGKYQLERRLGAGGMGIVYRGRHLDLRRDVAIKIIGAEADGFVDRFRIEAAALGRLKHPHIVDVMDFGVERARGIAYLVMELLEGTTLAARCKAGELERTEALTILDAVAQAVDFAHAHHILHRDLKPANIFLARSANGETVKILDFGLAQFLGTRAGGEPSDIRPMPGALSHRSASSNETTTIVSTHGWQSPDDTRGDLIELQEGERGLLMGTQGYMAPELLRLGPATPSSDLYALGVIAYELFTGTSPKPSSELTPPSAIGRRPPREFDAPILRLLDPVPAQRPTSARAAIAAIADAERTARGRAWRAREHPRRAVAAAAIAGVAAASSLLWRSPPVDRLERATIDARLAVASRRPPHPGILLVVLDDRSVDADSRPLALRADEFGAGLSRIFDAGAKAVAIDLLLPKAWSTSGAFAELIARHPDRLTLAAMSTDAGTVLGPECLPPVVPDLLGPERVAALFGLVNLEAGTDGVTRRVRLQYRDANGRQQPTWAARAAATAGTTSAIAPDRDRIDYTVDSGQMRRVSWGDASRLAETAPAVFRDRLVLVGGEFTGSGDDHQLPPGSGTGAKSVSGLVVQAMIVNTILDGFPIRETGRAAAIAGSCAASGVLAFLIMVTLRLARTLALAAILAAGYSAAAVAAFVSQSRLWPLSGPILSMLLAVAAAIVMRVWWGSPPEAQRR